MHFLKGHECTIIHLNISAWIPLHSMRIPSMPLYIFAMNEFRAWLTKPSELRGLRNLRLREDEEEGLIHVSIRHKRLRSPPGLTNCFHHQGTGCANNSHSQKPDLFSTFSFRENAHCAQGSVEKALREKLLMLRPLVSFGCKVGSPPCSYFLWGWPLCQTGSTASANMGFMNEWP